MLKFNAQRMLTAFLVITLLLTLLVGTFYFSSYTQEQLYQESVNQLAEITAQLFEKLEVQLDIQWGYLEKIDDDQKDIFTLEESELSAKLYEWEKELSPVGKPMNFIAVDDKGYYYNNLGHQGIWSYAEKLNGADRQCFLITDWIANNNQMAFAHKLKNSLSVDGNNITHFLLLKSMDDMAPFFRSSAFHNQNTTYVIDSNGTKMFSDTVLLELDFVGRNIFRSLENLTYPHGGSLEECLKKAQEHTFSCSDVIVNNRSYYIGIKTLNGYDWSMLFFVPAEYVAVSTRSMISSLVHVFVVVLIGIVLLGTMTFSLVMRFRKNQELLQLKTRSEAQLADANRRLEASNTNLERARSATVEALAAANTASKAKSEFLANMSHDIRTPMNAIIGMTTLIEHSAYSPEKVLEYVGKIRLSSNHLLDLINDVLDMSKIESGKTELNSGEFSICDVLDQLVIAFRPQTDARQQTFNVKLPQFEHPWLVGDSVRLTQILNNIVSNAVKYTQNGGTIILEAEEHPRQSLKYNQIIFRIIDNGIGMSKEYVAHIFESFTREESSVTNKVQGTGLGMAIVKHLVDLMGGVVRVESEQGRGSMFEVALEFKIAEAPAKAAAHVSEAEAEEISLEGIKFLCAEDNELNAEILSELLHMDGAECTIVSNGKLAVEEFKNSAPDKYDVILMDVQMPVMNGYDATRAIRSCDNVRARTIPIFAMTANAFSEDIQRSLDAGMNGHISKPVEMAKLKQAIQNFRGGGTIKGYSGKR